MYYDPIKNVFASIIRKYPFLRISFYKLLDLMFLRSWYVRRELRKIRAIFANKNIEILDAGCGYGQYTYYINKKLSPCNIKAVDVKEEWINDCSQFFNSLKITNVEFGIADLTKINFENKFDLINCIDVMEHIKNDVQVFENYYRALKTGGYLMVNSPSIYGGSDVHDDEGESFIGEHARDGYSFEDLKQKLEPLGFSILSFKYTYGYWGDKAWRLGIKYPMMLLNISKILFILLPFYYLLTFPFTLIMMYIDYKSKNKIGAGINIVLKK